MNQLTQPMKPVCLEFVCLELVCLLHEIHKRFFALSTEQYSLATQEVNDMAHSKGLSINDLAKILVHH